MAIEFFLIALAVVLFGGVILGLALGYRETEAQRAAASTAADKAAAAPGLYRWSVADAALAEELMLRQIEHHLRREALIAEQFIDNPNPQMLRAAEHQRLGVC